MLLKMKFNLFVKPNEQRQSREDLSDAMARKGWMKCGACKRQRHLT